MFSGCATTQIGADRYRFFTGLEPSVESPWVPKIEEWQQRERTDRKGDVLGPRVAPGAADRSSLLRKKFGAFMTERKRELARQFTEFSQREARRHYKSDPPTTLDDDHWPTLKELFDQNGDDCDGVDLIAYNLLRESGFQQGEIYRLIVRRERKRAYHMVTLWFEDRDDPWVIDTTGAMTTKMRRFSELPPGWTPIVMFDERERHWVGQVQSPAPRVAGD